MKKEIDIEQALLQNQYVLEVADGEVHTQILDLELDIVNCIIREDFIEIDTINLTYIQLDVQKLEVLIKLIKEGSKYYRSKKYKQTL
jgi:hypothetical protein